MFAIGASVNWSAPSSVARPAATNIGRTAAGGRKLGGEDPGSTACSGSGYGDEPGASWMQQVLAGGSGGACPGWHEATQVPLLTAHPLL